MYSAGYDFEHKFERPAEVTLLAEIHLVDATCEGVGPPGRSVRGERANLTRLVIGSIDAKFVRKYALEGSRRDLHNALTPLHRSLISIFSSKIAKNISRLNI